MATKKDASAVELGNVYQRLQKGKDTQGWLASINAEGVILKGVHSEWTKAIPMEDLQAKWKHVGKWLLVEGVEKVVPLDQIKSVPVITPERTEEPADPAASQEGEPAEGDADHAVDGDDQGDDQGDGDDELDEARETLHDQLADAAEKAGEARTLKKLTPKEAAIIAAMRGELRAVDVECKTKELRLFFQGHRGSIIRADDVQDMLDQMAQEFLTRWPAVSAEPKPGELPFKGTIPPPTVPKVDTAPAPAAATGANGDTHQAAQA